MFDGSELRVYFASSEVIVHGSYKHPEKGCYFEISGESIPRQSVSAWSLSFEDMETADELFKIFLGLTANEALIIDHGKGVFGNLNFHEISFEDIPEKDLVSSGLCTTF